MDKYHAELVTILFVLLSKITEVTQMFKQIAYIATKTALIALLSTVTSFAVLNHRYANTFDYQMTTEEQRKINAVRTDFITSTAVDFGLIAGLLTLIYSGGELLWMVSKAKQSKAEAEDRMKSAAPMTDEELLQNAAALDG